MEQIIEINKNEIVQKSEITKTDGDKQQTSLVNILQVYPWAMTHIIIFIILIITTIIIIGW